MNIPAKYSSSGRRERHFYKTRADALAAAAELREQREDFGDQARAIAPALAEQAVAAAKLLEPFGVSVLEAANAFVARKKAEMASKPLNRALVLFLKTKKGRSDSQRKAYRHMAQALITSFPKRVLSTIAAKELHEHVEAVTGTNSTFNARAVLLRAFWRWCARVPRGWCDATVADSLEEKDTSKSAIGILTTTQCKTLLATAEKHYPECVPAFAISLFTGIRDAELARLTPEHITAEGISIPATSAKLGTRRFIEMPAPLAAWLEAYPVGETILPANWERKDKAVRRLAGWKVWTDLVDPPEPPEDLPAWPHNALRHTHASVSVAMGKSLDVLTFEFGHSGGAATLKAHYVGAMSKAEAIKIWSIGPKGTKLDLIVAA